MNKFLVITICFFLFFSVFSALTYFDFQGVQVEFSLEHRDHCHVSYLFQGTKEGSLKSFSLFELNSDNFYLARIQPFSFDTVLNSQQKLDQISQFLAVVQIE